MPSVDPVLVTVLVLLVIPARDYGARRVEELDAIRGGVADAVAAVAPGMVVDTIFTTDPKWANADL